jgi:hypothetical protein
VLRPVTLIEVSHLPISGARHLRSTGPAWRGLSRRIEALPQTCSAARFVSSSGCAA